MSISSYCLLQYQPVLPSLSFATYKMGPILRRFWAGVLRLRWGDF